MKKRILTLLLAFTVLLAVGCAKTEPEPPEQPEQSVQSAQPETAVEQEKPAEQTVQTDEAPESETPEEAADAFGLMSAQWVKEAPEGVQRVNVDENGELILLKTEQTLQNIWICRVQYNEQTKDYDRTEKLWWMNEWQAGSELLIEMKLPMEQPELEISWEDEFSERDRRLIVPNRLIFEDRIEETALLMHYAVPLSPMELTQKTPFHYDMDSDAMKETVDFVQPDASGAGAVLRIKKDDAVFEQKMAVLKDCCCWIADLDGNGEAEIYVSGDAVDGEYRTYGWTLDENGIRCVTFRPTLQRTDANGAVCIDGAIEKMEDSIVYLKRELHVADRSYTGHAYYAVTDDQLEPLDGYWTLDRAEAVKLKAPLAVTFDNGTETTLKKGTALYFAATDLQTLLKLETEDGLQTTWDVSVKNGVWSYEGKPLGDLFE